jgi:putative phosphoesterase
VAERLRKKAAMNIGVISDTHGLIRPEALAALSESRLILHAGDIGSLSVLDALMAIAPVVAVRGNCDKGPWAQELPGVEVVEEGAHLIYLLHDLKELDLDPAAAGFRVVISGHSHKPAQQEREGVLYLNPGSAGPRRFKLPVTVARLRFDATHVDVEIIELSVGHRRIG